MNLIVGIIATCGFELRRALTIQRISISLVLALFPPLMLFFLTWGARFLQRPGMNVENEVVSQTLIMVPSILVFLVGMVCLLSLLLWATTNIYSELEGKGWIFVSSRPRGRLSILFGKYFAAVIQSFAICQIAISLSLLISASGSFPDPTHLWISLSGIMLIASFVYGAILSFIGVMFYRRAMVVGAGYLIAIEFFVANIPALVCNFTVRRHLQDLGIRWIGWLIPGNQSWYNLQFGWYSSAWVNLGALAVILVVALFFAATIIQNREYITGDET